MSCALVAAVDLAGVCEVKSGDGWEFCGCFRGSWENCSACSDADVEDLYDRVELANGIFDPGKVVLVY
jgi:hypothetical protein